MNFNEVFFCRLKEWLLRQAGRSWDYPEPIYDLLRKREVRTLALDYANQLPRTRLLFGIGS